MNSRARGAGMENQPDDGDVVDVGDVTAGRDLVVDGGAGCVCGCCCGVPLWRADASGIVADKIFPSASEAFQVVRGALVWQRVAHGRAIVGRGGGCAGWPH